MTFLIQQTLIYAVPLMIVALAGVFAERSGIINLALEGIMILARLSSSCSSAPCRAWRCLRRLPVQAIT